MSEFEHAEPIVDDDARIASALQDAHIPSLMLALVHLTGDMELLRGDIHPIMEFLNPDDGLTDEQRQRVRQRALETLIQHRDDPRAFYVPSQDDIRESEWLGERKGVLEMRRMYGGYFKGFRSASKLRQLLMEETTEAGVSSLLKRFDPEETYSRPDHRPVAVKKAQLPSANKRRSSTTNGM